MFGGLALSMATLVAASPPVPPKKVENDNAVPVELSTET
jgi:hypothetical protein